jgi:nucleotide-binding universal stress UspA family protein
MESDMTYPYPFETSAVPAVPAADPLRLIVAATDFTPAAAAAARRAAALAEAAGARLVLFHAQRSGDAEKARERLRRAAARLRGGAALEVDAHLGYGPAAAAIAAFARAASPDLVVVGNRQPGFLADLLGLGTADRVRRRGASLVLAVARPARLPYGRVVVASDLSQRAADALQTVRRLFPAAETHVLHACPTLYEGTLHFTGVGIDLVEAYRRQAIAIGERRLAHFMAKTRAGTGVLAATRLGEAAPAIREYAKEVAADVVIVSPGKSWLARMVGNSVSEQILADPPCDVLLAA